KVSPRASASVRTSSVLAVPGMPVIRQCPPTSRVSSRWSRTSSCPTMILRTCARIAAIRSLNVCTSARTSRSAAAATASFIAIRLLDDLQQEGLRRLEMRRDGQRVEHTPAAGLAIPERTQGARGAEVGRRRIVTAQRQQYLELAQRAFGVVGRQQSLAKLRVMLRV